jgi:acyl-coenzyme A thioesterase PaaI-like protein
VSSERLVHHELCFACGRTNLFGLLMDVQPVEQDRVRARGFVKQDHQGAERGACHEGVIVAALSDAMALAGGSDLRPIRLEVELRRRVSVGSFLDVAAEIVHRLDDDLEATATAAVEGQCVASARGVFTR